MHESLYKGHLAWLFLHTLSAIRSEYINFIELYSFYCIFLRIYFAVIFTQKYFRLYVVFFQNREFGEYFCKMPPKNRIKRRGSQEMERMSTQVPAQSLEVDELNCVPETQQSLQAAGVEEMVVGLEDHLHMSDTEQGDIAPETQQDLDSSDEDIADTKDTQAIGGHRRARAQASARASQPQGRDNLHQKIRLTKGERKQLLCSVMRMSRN